MLFTRLALALAVLLVVGVPAAAASSDAPADAVEQAQLFFNAKQYREAIAALGPYLSAHPLDAHALVLRGDAKASVDDNQGALADYNAAIAAEPGYQYAYRTRCETRLEVDDKDGALMDCNVAIKLDSRDGRAFQDRADVYFEQAAYPESLADYNTAESLGRSSAYLYGSRCDANRLTNNLEPAAADCRKALVLDPKSPTALWANARLAIANARYDDSIAFWNTYLGVNPKGAPAAYYWQASAYNRTAHWQAALTDLATYFGHVSDDADGFRERAFARVGTGDRAGAVADLNEASRLYLRDGNEKRANELPKFLKAIQAGQPLPPLPTP